MTDVSRSGLVLLDKEAGLSSFAALGALKAALRGEKVGHTGTLDPFATGLLVAVIGSCTRLAPGFTNLDKSYRAVIRFGAETSTLDPEGDIVATSGIPSEAAIRDALPAFSGDIMQAPPAISAVHIDGERAWKRARRGETVLPPARPVRIHDIAIESYDGADLTVTVRCSSGTYIRSLARDLAIACGARASLAALRRLSVGPFRVEDVASEDATKLQSATKLEDATKLQSATKSEDATIVGPEIRPFDAATAAAMGFPILVLDDARTQDFRNGRPLRGVTSGAASGAANDAAAGIAGDSAMPTAAFGPGGDFLGLVTLDMEKTKYHMVVAR